MVQLEQSESGVSDGPDGGGRRSPVRTCVGCRTRERAADLLRIVVRDDVLVPDPAHRLPGRGAWLHPVSSCLGTAERRRAFGRALRVSGQLDISILERYVESSTAETRDRHEHS